MALGGVQVQPEPKGGGFVARTAPRWPHLEARQGGRTSVPRTPLCSFVPGHCSAVETGGRGLVEGNSVERTAASDSLWATVTFRGCPPEAITMSFRFEGLGAGSHTKSKNKNHKGPRQGR